MLVETKYGCVRWLCEEMYTRSECAEYLVWVECLVAPESNVSYIPRLHQCTFQTRRWRTILAKTGCNLYIIRPASWGYLNSKKRIDEREGAMTILIYFGPLVGRALVHSFCVEFQSVSCDFAMRLVHPHCVCRVQQSLYLLGHEMFQSCETWYWTSLELAVVAE